MAEVALLSLYMAIIVDNLGGFMMAPTLPFEVVEKLHGTPTQYGLMQSSFAGMQVLGTLLMGKLSDFVGRRVVLLMCLGATAVTLFLFGQAQTLTQLFVFRALDGFFSGTIGVAQAYLADLVEPSERPGAMAKAGACLGLGLVLGPAVGGGLASFGFSVVCYVAAGITLLNFIIATVSLPSVPPLDIDEEAEPPASLFTLVSKDEQLPTIYATQFLQMLAMGIFSSMLAIAFHDQYGTEATDMGRILLVAGVVMVFAQALLAKRMTSCLGERNCIFFGNAIRAIDYIPPLLSDAPFIPYVLPMVFTFTSALTMPQVASLVASRAPAAQRGVVMGGMQSLGGVASTIGPFLGGQVYVKGPKMVWLTMCGIAVAASLTILTIRAEVEEKATPLLNTEEEPSLLKRRPLAMRRNSRLSVIECAGPETSAFSSMPTSLMTPDSGGTWGVHGNLIAALATPSPSKLKRRSTWNGDDTLDHRMQKTSTAAF